MNRVSDPQTTEDLEDGDQGDADDAVFDEPAVRSLMNVKLMKSPTLTKSMEVSLGPELVRETRMEDFGSHDQKSLSKQSSTEADFH